MNLVEAWLEMQREQGLSLASACALLRKRLGQKHSPSRLIEWRSGKRPLPGSVEHLMRQEVMPWLFARHALDIALWPCVQNIIEEILPPARIVSEPAGANGLRK